MTTRTYQRMACHPGGSRDPPPRSFNKTAASGSRRDDPG